MKKQQKSVVVEAAEAKTSNNFGIGSNVNNNNGSKSQEYDVTKQQSAVEGNTAANTISTCDIRTQMMAAANNYQQQGKN